MLLQTAPSVRPSDGISGLISPLLIKEWAECFQHRRISPVVGWGVRRPSGSQALQGQHNAGLFLLQPCQVVSIPVPGQSRAVLCATKQAGRRDPNPDRLDRWEPLGVAVRPREAPAPARR